MVRIKDLTNIGQDAVEPVPVQDELSQEEESLYKKEENLLKIAREKALLKNLEQDIEQRKIYASKIYNLVLGWLILVYILLLICAETRLNLLELSDTVLIAILSGTTVNILGIFAIVTRYLFPSTQKA